MAEFINTVDVVGDEALTNSIIDRSIAEYNDSNVKVIGQRAFHSCAALTSIDLPAVTSIGDSAFCRCSALVNVNIPIVTNIDGYAFENCASLKIVDLPSVTSIGNGAFIRSSAFATLILRNTKQCAALLGTSVFKNTPVASGNGYIYVPRDLVDSYKSATNWSTYANQFRALEDWTVDGTITGELDVANRRMVRFFNSDGTLLGYKVVTVGSAAVYDGTPVCPEDSSWEFKGFLPEPTNVTEDMDCYAQYQEPFSLETASWARISEISAAGEGANYFSVGDTKSVALKGTMGTLALDKTLYVYILGFDHNSDVEGKGVQFGGFKTTNGSDGVNVCLVDSHYNDNNTSGAKWFNIQHWGYSNHGGWARCDIRYDILGSTDIAPMNYGKKAASGDIGYNATPNCATEPVANTLMSCLPADLRAVMKPIVKYSDNVGGRTDTEANVTSTIDYLPLLAEFEIFGTSNYANSAEQKYQRKYDYYNIANVRKFKHSAPETSARWWGRSVSIADNAKFLTTSPNATSNMRDADDSYGVAPAFMV